MIRAIEQNCARLYEWSVAALHSGVEQTADVVCLQEPPIDRQRFNMRHTAYDRRTKKTVSTTVRNASDLAVDEWMDLSKGGYHDVVVTDVRRRGEKVTTLLNIYD